jgi:hypothetical protein
MRDATGPGQRTETPIGAPDGREVVAQGLGDRESGVLAGAVGAESGRGEKAHHRGGVHDVGGAVLEQQARDEAAQAVDDPHHIGGKHPLPVFERLLPDDAAGRDSGVVAEDRDVAADLESPAREGIERARVGHVGRDADAPGRGREAAAGRFEALRVEVGEHEPRSLVGERLGERASDAGSCTRDDDDAVPERAHQRRHPARAGRGTRIVPALMRSVRSSRRARGPRGRDSRGAARRPGRSGRDAC